MANIEIEIRSSFLNQSIPHASDIKQFAKLDKPSDSTENNRWVWESTVLCKLQIQCTYPTVRFYFINLLYYKEYYFAELTAKYLYLGGCFEEHII